MTKEEWKDIKGFEGYYQISNKGRVQSLDRYVIANNHGGQKLLKGKIMKLAPVITKRKEATHYLCVNLRKDGYNEVYKVHRLVAEAFIPNPNNLPIPNHIDGNKANNDVSNLEWTTYGENNQHALDMNLRKPRGKVVIQYDLNHNFICEYKSVTEASRITGLGRGSISHCLNGRQESYMGYIWGYK